MKKNLLGKYALAVLKFAVPAAIIAWLVFQVQRNDPDTYRNLRDRPKDWALLAGAFSMAMLAVSTTFVRWYLLVRALRLQFRLRDAVRLGFLGFLLSFVSAGAVGGDLFKAFFIARDQPGRRAEAVATVVVDRMIGLYALLIVASAAIFTIGVPNGAPEVVALCRMTVLGAILGGAAVGVMLVPGFTHGRLSKFLSGLPKVGSLLGRLIDAVRMYRSKPAVLGAAGAMSLGVHCLLAGSIYLIGRALFAGSAMPGAPAESLPTAAEHFIIVPLGMVAGALPFTPAGLGVFEAALALLYQYVPAGGGSYGQGLVVALAYRVVTVGVAVVGVVYYWTSRREVTEVLHEAELERASLERQSPGGC